MAKNAIRRENEKMKSVVGDDRNLVLVDDDFQDADFEDKVWLFWRRHGKKTVAAAVVVFLAAFSAIIYTQGKKMHVAALQNDYAALKTADERRAFAAAHTGDAMAGTIFYALGNEGFAEGKFVEAAADYAAAAAVFAEKSEPEFALPRDRAKFSEAVALDKSGKKDDARERLVELASSLRTDETVRGQAMYNLAVLALSAGDVAVARKWLDEMDRALSPQNMWHSEKSNLIRLEPSLSAAPAESVPAPVAAE